MCEWAAELNKISWCGNDGFWSLICWRNLRDSENCLNASICFRIFSTFYHITIFHQTFGRICFTLSKPFKQIQECKHLVNLIGLRIPRTHNNSHCQRRSVNPICNHAFMQDTETRKWHVTFLNVWWWMMFSKIWIPKFGWILGKGTTSRKE